ncbi:MAG: DEAD/DEAH box helicase family protein [Gloeomargarita sp. SKYBB_i_bin120]|nr:DEAD/DEAH box helicase family protein [Gloeomargarita sp. SKYG98]MCS7292030.1 DEAD/DEAH box helicase family protein [Gloeomargarita sp. SKYB120]MDW8177590.1 DEAD/DEAH box helicase family protein [Gloeomargarita sp. SKYBB_i_bin120]
MTKTLWPYQQEALETAVEFLRQYYADLTLSTDERKQRLWRTYLANGIDPKAYDERFPEQQRLSSTQRQIGQLYRAYGLLDAENCLPFWRICNRAGFWMATGSGKTLIIVKLVEQLAKLMSDQTIPQNDILLLSHREELLNQIRAHVAEYNQALPEYQIVLEDLKQFPEIKRFQPSLPSRAVTVFIANADHLTLEQKQKELDFRNYENGGRWYIILDEAHRGDSKDSLRKAIFNIMSRNGFLFNFSATFTDPKDQLTTIYNLNLSEFVRQGYGKHIAILPDDTSAYSAGDYTNERKQEIVLQALLLLTYLKRIRAELPVSLPYHSPLLVVFVNSVQAANSDLELFFRELERVGRGQVPPTCLEQAKRMLVQHLQSLSTPFSGEKHVAPPRVTWLTTFQLQDILQHVYHAESPGLTEVIISAQDQREMALKLKTGERPYALIRIGETKNWLQKQLRGVEILESVQEQTFFASLNQEDSPINILLGSRMFYEGWDSSRPNIALYVNIGKQQEARKFVLQSIGRGVRISPAPGVRGRLEKHPHLQAQVADSHWVEPLETLFICAASRPAMHHILATLDAVQQPVSSFNQRVKRVLSPPKLPQNLSPFAITPEDLHRLQRYVAHVDPRILWAAHGYQPCEIRLLHKVLNRARDYFQLHNAQPVPSIRQLLSKLHLYLVTYGHLLDDGN